MKIFEITKKELLDEKWSEKYKKSIDCNNPKGFSQKAHCKGRLKEEDENLSGNNGISIRFGRSAKFDGYTKQNVIVSYNGEDITGQLPKTNQEDEDLGNYKSGYLYLILPDNDNVAYVGDVSIPEKLRGQGIGKKIYQAIADKIKKPIRNSMENKSIDMNFYGQFKDGQNFWKNRDSFQPNLKPLDEKWSKKYKRSIDCNNPKGFSQKAHCKGRLKEDAKSGTPEELFELLKLLPIDETAKELTNQIMSDLKDYYQNNGELPPIKTYAYQPEDKCIQPYELEVDFKQKKGAAVVGVGYAEQHYIQLYILQKDVEAAYFRVLSLPDKIFNIIKHECSHHYLSQKGIESCLYHTHPDGMKKYYYDRQEIVLHSREIFDELDKKVPNWRNEPLDKIRVYIADKVKDLRDNIYIYQPFPQSLRNKYVAFIMNNYIKPNHNSINKSLNEKTDFSKEKEQGLHGWFARQGGKGKSKGWVDCNTCRDGKCKSCGRKEGESRSKYPACRPTPSACKTKGKGKSWGKKSTNEDVLFEQSKQDIERELKLNEIKNTFKRLIK